MVAKPLAPEAPHVSQTLKMPQVPWTPEFAAMVAKPRVPETPQMPLTPKTPKTKTPKKTPQMPRTPEFAAMNAKPRVLKTLLSPKTPQRLDPSAPVEGREGRAAAGGHLRRGGRRSLAGSQRTAATSRCCKLRLRHGVKESSPDTGARELTGLLSRKGAARVPATSAKR